MDIFWMEDQRRLVGDTNLSGYGPRKLGEVQLRTSARHHFFDPFPDPLLDSLGHHLDDIFDADVRIPDSKRVHSRKLAHVLAVAASRSLGAIAALIVGQSD